MLLLPHEPRPDSAAVRATARTGSLHTPLAEHGGGHGILPWGGPHGQFGTVAVLGRLAGRQASRRPAGWRSWSGGPPPHLPPWELAVGPAAPLRVSLQTGCGAGSSVRHRQGRARPELPDPRLHVRHLAHPLQQVEGSPVDLLARGLTQGRPTALVPRRPVRHHHLSGVWSMIQPETLTEIPRPVGQPRPPGAPGLHPSGARNGVESRAGPPVVSELSRGPTWRRSGGPDPSLGPLSAS